MNEGFWLVRTESGKIIVQISFINSFVESELLVGVPGFAWKPIGTFEREFNVIKWIKQLNLEELWNYQKKY